MKLSARNQIQGTVVADRGTGASRNGLSEVDPT